MKNVVCALTPGDLRSRSEQWFDWDEIRLILGIEFFPLELGFNRHEDGDWTSVENFRSLLDQMSDQEEVKFHCDGKSVVVVEVEDEGEPTLVVEEVAA